MLHLGFKITSYLIICIYLFKKIISLGTKYLFASNIIIRVLKKIIKYVSYH